MQIIAEAGQGALFYLRQEGRGIGLMNKVRAYHLQDQGADTVEANEALGFGADQRNYEILAPMAQQLGIHKVRLMTNNPRKVQALMAWASRWWSVCLCVVVKIATIKSTCRPKASA